jgi:hypothetical protein
MRVVRFTDVDPDRLESLTAEINESQGPPEGIRAKGIQVLLDRDQRTSVVIQTFETAEDMQASEDALNAMDPSDTPGTRMSVDRCEVTASMGAVAAS